MGLVLVLRCCSAVAEGCGGFRFPLGGMQFPLPRLREFAGEALKSLTLFRCGGSFGEKSQKIPASTGIHRGPMVSPRGAAGPALSGGG